MSVREREQLLEDGSERSEEGEGPDRQNFCLGPSGYTLPYYNPI